MIAVVLYVCVTIQFIFVCIMMPDAGMATTRRYHKVSAFFVSRVPDISGVPEKQPHRPGGKGYVRN